MTAALGRSPVVLLSGPGQSGKTTLAREFLKPDSENCFDLENPMDLIRLEEPFTALSPLKGLVVIDEVRRRPDVFPVLRVLAGRMEKVCIAGFTLDETGEDELHNPGSGEAFPLHVLQETWMKEVSRKSLLKNDFHATEKFPPIETRRHRRHH